MSTSKLQRSLSDTLRDYDHLFIIKENHRPEWLQNDDGERLELDFYIEDIDLAVEVQGCQHYVYTPHFHATYGDFEKQQRHDERKRQVCRQRGIDLIEIDTEDEIYDVIDKIEEIIQKKFEEHGNEQVAAVIYKNRMESLRSHVWRTLKNVRRAGCKDQRYLKQKAIMSVSNILIRHGTQVIYDILGQEADELFHLVAVIERKHRNKQMKKDERLAAAERMKRRIERLSKP